MISIIVPLWNHLKDLTRPFVESMLNLEDEFQLILVDNGSRDRTWEYISKIKDKRVTAIHSKRNLGFGGGNNLGYEEVKYDQVLFLSNDVLINDKDFLMKIHKRLREKPRHLIGPQYVDYNRLTEWEYMPTPYMAGWCVAGTKKLFDDIIKADGQIWNEEFGLAYFEDVWLSVLAGDVGDGIEHIELDLVHLISKSSDQINISQEAQESQLIFRDKMLKRELKAKNQKRVVFFVPGVPYPFVDSDYEQKGVGGAEASLILLSRELAKKGYRVEIYNNTQVSGKFNGVYYGNIEEFVPFYYTDYFVLFRSYHSALDYVDAKVKIFWSCDQWTDMPAIWNANIFPEVDLTVCISNYHADYLQKHHNPGRMQVIDLGVNYDDYSKRVDKVPGKCIYCSVPDRGIDKLLDLAPAIKARVPEFHLVVTSDYRLWGTDDPGDSAHRRNAQPLDYITYLGKVRRDVLVKHQNEAVVMTYPSNYPECFCIAAMECMAAGAVPVTTNNGALPTTVGDGGIVLSNSEVDEKFVDSVVELITNDKKRSEIEERSRQLGKEHSWSLIVDEWIELFNKEESMANAKTETKGAAKKKAPKKPMASLPKEVRILFTQPVEVAINGRKFMSTPDKENHVIVAPSDYANSIVQIIVDAHGKGVLA